MLTGLIWGGFFVFGVIIGAFMFRKIQSSKKETTKFIQTEVKPEQVTALVSELLNPHREKDERIKYKEENSVLKNVFGIQWEEIDQKQLDSLKEEMYQSMLASREGEQMNTEFSKNADEQIHDHEPAKISPTEEEINEFRRRSAVINKTFLNSPS